MSWTGWFHLGAESGQRAVGFRHLLWSFWYKKCLLKTFFTCRVSARLWKLCLAASTLQFEKRKRLVGAEWKGHQIGHGPCSQSPFIISIQSLQTCSPRKSTSPSYSRFFLIDRSFRPLHAITWQRHQPCDWFARVSIEPVGAIPQSQHTVMCSAKFQGICSCSNSGTYCNPFRFDPSSDEIINCAKTKPSKFPFAILLCCATVLFLYLHFELYIFSFLHKIIKKSARVRRIRP